MRHRRDFPAPRSPFFVSRRIGSCVRSCVRACVFLSPEFLEAEGLTEAQLRDACEGEMQAKDPGGLSFMHTLISSWEFSRQAIEHSVGGCGKSSVNNNNLILRKCRVFTRVLMVSFAAIGWCSLSERVPRQ